MPTTYTKNYALRLFYGATNFAVLVRVKAANFDTLKVLEVV